MFEIDCSVYDTNKVNNDSKNRVSDVLFTALGAVTRVSHVLYTCPQRGLGPCAHAGGRSGIRPVFLYSLSLTRTRIEQTRVIRMEKSCEFVSYS